MTHWYFVRDGRREGPVSAEFIADELRSGHLSQQDLVWSEGQEAWQPIADLPDLLKLASTLPPPLPAPVAAPEDSPAPLVSGPVLSAPSYAPFQLRLLATLLDQLVLTIPGIVLGLIVLGALHANYEGFDVTQPGDFDRFRDMVYLVGIFANWLYCAAYEASPYQATPGMMVMGLRASTADGRRLSFVQATFRHFLRAFSWWFGWFPALTLPTRQMLHDIVIGAVVTQGHARPTGNPFRPDGMI